MCLLTVFEPDAAINVQYMTEAAYNNPDGFGFALHMGEHIARFRSMSFTETLAEFEKMRGLYPDTWAIFHHRFSTGGGETVDNCHPFTWGHDERIAVAHNGVLPIPAGKRKSDTRIWTENHLANISPGNLDNREWWDKTEKWLGTSKAAILTVHPEPEYAVYILNEDLGHWKDGVWYSNRSYEIYRPSRYTAMYGSTTSFTKPAASDDKDATDLIACSVCDTAWDPGDKYDDTECPLCGTCWVCDIGAELCMCWDGPRDRKSESETYSIADDLAALDAAGISPEQHFRHLWNTSIGSDGP